VGVLVVGVVELRECVFEQLALVLFRDAKTLINHFDPELCSSALRVLICSCVDNDVFLVRKLDCIAQQVDQHLLNAIFVAIDLLHVAGHQVVLQVDLYASDLALKLHHCDSVGKRLQNVELRLDFVEVEVL